MRILTLTTWLYGLVLSIVLIIDLFVYNIIKYNKLDGSFGMIP